MIKKLSCGNYGEETDPNGVVWLLGYDHPSWYDDYEVVDGEVRRKKCH